MQSYKKSIHLLLFFLLSTTILCQNQFKKCSVEKHSGEKITGYISYGNWAKNPSEIRFKSDLSSEIQSFSPSIIKSFTIDNDEYVGALVEIEISSTNTNQLDSDPALRIKEDWVFLKCIIKGNKSLYHLKLLNGRDNFYFEDEGIFHLLKYKRYLVEHDAKIGSKENRQYKSQLSNYLQDCPNVNSYLGDLDYKLKSLKKNYTINMKIVLKLL